MSVIMKIFLFVLLEKTLAKDFKVYWNIPTFMCQKHGVSFADSVTKFGIIQNSNDAFRGDKFAILYDPGMFPALLETNAKTLYRRNGGIPQKGNLNDHLEVFKKHINELVPDAAFNGICVIDFESWRPTFRQNFGSLQPYKDISFSDAREKLPLMTEKRLQVVAANQFEKFAKLFMEETIKLAKQMRPNAKWGYYGFPYCFNGNANNIESCGDEVKEETDNLKWLFTASDFVNPSVYIYENSMAVENRPKMVRGRVREAVRAANQAPNNPFVLAYVRYNYADTKALMTKVDMQRLLRNVKSEGGDGVILWGSSNDITTKEDCDELAKFLEKTMGPMMANSILRDYMDEDFTMEPNMNDDSWNSTEY